MPVLPAARADGAVLVMPGLVAGLSLPVVPPLLKGLKVYPDDPLRFDFILDPGDPSARASLEQTQEIGVRMIRYFLAAMTIPDDEMWVNLSPFEKDRIVPERFGLTEMGRDLLAQDNVLKQLSASLLHPDSSTGRIYWAEVYRRAFQKYGTTDIPFETVHKVWVVPGSAEIREDQGSKTVYVVAARLKVMMDKDYLAAHESAVSSGAGAVEMAAEVFRQMILPKIEREVNEGEAFAPLRQAYHALILAVWLQDKIRGGALSRAYSETGKTRGITLDDVPAGDQLVSTRARDIYTSYVASFRKGAFNLIREERDEGSGDLIPRQYFSGGVTFLGRLVRQVIKPAGRVARSMVVSAGILIACSLQSVGAAEPLAEPAPESAAAFAAALKESQEAQKYFAQAKMSSVASEYPVEFQTLVAGARLNGLVESGKEQEALAAIRTARSIVSDWESTGLGLKAGEDDFLALFNISYRLGEKKALERGASLIHDERYRFLFDYPGHREGRYREQLRSLIREEEARFQVRDIPAATRSIMLMNLASLNYLTEILEVPRKTYQAVLTKIMAQTVVNDPADKENRSFARQMDGNMAGSYGPLLLKWAHHNGALSAIFAHEVIHNLITPFERQTEQVEEFVADLGSLALRRDLMGNAWEAPLIAVKQMQAVSSMNTSMKAAEQMVLSLDPFFRAHEKMGENAYADDHYLARKLLLSLYRAHPDADPAALLKAAFRLFGENQGKKEPPWARDINGHLKENMGLLVGPMIAISLGQTPRSAEYYESLGKNEAYRIQYSLRGPMGRERVRATVRYAAPDESFKGDEDYRVVYSLGYSDFRKLYREAGDRSMLNSADKVSAGPVGGIDLDRRQLDLNVEGGTPGVWFDPAAVVQVTSGLVPRVLRITAGVDVRGLIGIQ